MSLFDWTDIDTPPVVVTIDPVQGLASQRMAERFTDEIDDDAARAAFPRLRTEREAVRQWGLYSMVAAHAVLGGAVDKSETIGARMPHAFELVANALRDRTLAEAVAAGSGILDAKAGIGGAFHAVALNRAVRLMVSSSRSSSQKAIDPVIFDVLKAPPGEGEIPPPGVLDDLIPNIPGLNIPGFPKLAALGLSPLAILGVTVGGVAAVVAGAWVVESVMTADSEVQIETARAHSNAQAMVASEVAIAKIQAGLPVDVPPLVASMAQAETRANFWAPLGLGLGLGGAALGAAGAVAWKKGWL